MKKIVSTFSTLVLVLIIIASIVFVKMVSDGKVDDAIRASGSWIAGFFHDLIKIVHSGLSRGIGEDGFSNWNHTYGGGIDNWSWR